MDSPAEVLSSTTKEGNEDVSYVNFSRKKARCYTRLGTLGLYAGALVQGGKEQIWLAQSLQYRRDGIHELFFDQIEFSFTILEGEVVNHLCIHNTSKFEFRAGELVSIQTNRI